MDWGERWLNGTRSVYAPTPNAEDDEIDWFQEDMNHLLKKMSFSSSVIEVQK